MILLWQKPLKVDVISSKWNGLRQTSLPNFKCKYKIKKRFTTLYIKK